MCRQAATNVAGRTCGLPREYQGAFISCPKPMMTRWPKGPDAGGVRAEVAAGGDRRDRRIAGSIWTSVTA
jgi:hypothetical protein